jgi:putative ABC transport system permease protein
MAEPRRTARAVLAEWAELAFDALREIRAHPLRSLLTLSGIVFGAASLVAMTSLAAATMRMATEELEMMGMPRTFEYYDRGPREDATRAADLRHPGLKIADAEALRRMDGVERSFVRTYGGNVLVGTTLDQRVVPVAGIDAGYLEFRSWPVVSGRELAPLDVVNASRVAILGSELAEPFFGNANPVGRTLLIGGVRFTVVGVVAPTQFKFIPADFSFLARRVYIPYSYITRYYLGESRIQNVLVQTTEELDFASKMAEAAAILKQRHGGAEDFDLDNEAANLAEDLAMADGILTGWNAVLFTIAGVTLVVGGIGLFSVLLISGRERVREIGIRMALGADERQIVKLFLAESLTLAFIGALAGIGVGTALIFVTEQISRNFGRDFAVGIYLPGVLLAVLFALMVGVVFGWYPSRRASKLNPIEAIRAL